MSVNDLIRILFPGINIIVRRAFGDDNEGDCYGGTVSNFPDNHTYANREVLFIFPHGERGDTGSIADANSLDIAVSDFDIKE